jgi:hypothetical protein
MMTIQRCLLRLGVEVYPSTFLVNPAGRLVGAATIKDLAAKLGT